MIKNKKIVVSLATVGVLATAAVGGTLAYFTDSDSRTNVITLGQVTGTLTETDELLRDNGTKGKDYTNIKPGDKLAKDPTVTLGDNSEDAYVRVKLHFTNNKTKKDLDSSLVSDIEEALVLNKGWSKSEDGYYYYNTVLSNKPNSVKTSKVFEYVNIPTDWNNEQAGISFNIDITAEYIQADNFTPVKDAKTGNITGWGNVAIEKNTSAK